MKLHARDDLTPTGSLSDAITSAGGTHVAGDVWEMPTSKTLAIIQREDIYRATLESPTATTNPRIDATLNDIIVALAGTVPAEAAVQYSMFTHEDGVVVEAHVPTAKMATAVRNWAAQQDIYVPAATDVHGDAHNFAFLIPADKIAPLMAYHTVDLTLTTGRIKGHSAPLTRSRWSEGARKTEQAIVAPYLPGYVRPASPEEGVTGAAPVWGTELTEKLKRHGMYRWHNDYQYQGLGVTIGIIDWGFADVDKLSNLADSDIDAVDDWQDTDGNSFCQSTETSIIPNATILFGDDDDPCEPVASLPIFGLDLFKMRHGTNIFELVRDMAPRAKILKAQANSPQQVYDAARWLDNMGAHIIVHAGGWHYDGPGDGRSYFDTDTYATSTGKDEHSVERYYPSPLATVDWLVDEGGPIWVNAAGNQDRYTMWWDSPTLINNSDSNYHGYLKFDPTASSESLQTCQSLPVLATNVAYYSMRWADDWPKAAFDLDFYIQAAGQTSGSITDSKSAEQFPRNYAVRRTANYTALGDPGACLRIKVNTTGNATPIAPNWVQFQALTGKDAFGDGPDWKRDTTSGRSIVNPAESNNPGLLAIGALDLQNKTSDEILAYSSNGPVYDPYSDLTEDTPARIKPDAVAGSRASTFTKWKYECKFNATGCGDKIYFGGTSAATAHTGGLAALAQGWFNKWGSRVTHDPEILANFLRSLARDEGIEGDDNIWGKGFILFPCPAVGVTSFPYTSSGENWASTDCESKRWSGRVADFYTFRLTETRRVTIDLDSSEDSFLALIDGPHADGDLLAYDNNSGPGTDARLIRDLHPGFYTVKATTFYTKKKGDYTLTASTADVPKAPSLTPNPATYSFQGDGVWQRFTVDSSDRVKVVVNPGDTKLRMEITAVSGASYYCPAEQDDYRTVSDDDYVYLAGCGNGEAVIQIQNRSDGTVLKEYIAWVEKAPAGSRGTSGASGDEP